MKWTKCLDMHVLAVDVHLHLPYYPPELRLDVFYSPFLTYQLSQVILDVALSTRTESLIEEVPICSTIRRP